MNKKEYKSLLRDPRWKIKRLGILKRDNNTCQHCKKSKKYLHVHHIWYIDGRDPWDVPDEFLITLCKGCHKKEHENKPISSFILTEYKESPKLFDIPPIQKKKRNKKS